MAYNAGMYQNVPMNQVQPFYQGSNIVGQSNIGSMYQQPQQMFPNLSNMPYTLTAAYTQGEIGARSHPVAAGNTVVLLDSDSIDTDKPIIYIKTTGYDGKPLSIKKIEGVVSYPNEQGLFNAPTQDTKSDIDLSEFIKKEDIESYQTKVDSITERIDSLDLTISSLSESLTNIDNRFTNMFSAFNSNDNTNNPGKSSNGNNNNNSNNGNQKK